MGQSIGGNWQVKKLKIISFGLKNNHANICFKKLLKFKSDYLLTINVNSIKKVFIINKELKPYIYNTPELYNKSKKVSDFYYEIPLKKEDKLLVYRISFEL